MPRIKELRKWRVRELLTQEQLANMADVSQSTVARAEAGFVISITNAKRITGRLGMGPNNVIDEQEAT